MLIRKQSLQQEQVVQRCRDQEAEAIRDTGEVTEDSLRYTNVSCLIEKVKRETWGPLKSTIQ